MNAAYRATTWAKEKSMQEIYEEIRACDERYYKPYPLNGTENANDTIIRMRTLELIAIDKSYAEH